MTVEGHLCLDAFHVGDVGEPFVHHFPELPSVVGRNDVRVVLGISLHRIPHLLVDGPSRVLQLHAQFTTSSSFVILMLMVTNNGEMKSQNALSVMRGFVWKHRNVLLKWRRIDAWRINEANYNICTQILCFYCTYVLSNIVCNMIHYTNTGYM